MSIAPGLLRPERPVPRPLGELADALGLAACGVLAGVAVTGLAARTQDLRPGDLFAALPGGAAHGADFVQRARDVGAVAVLTDERGAELAAGAGLPLLVADDARAVLGEVAAWVHRTRERMPLLLGVTGTNGKTTTVHLLEHLLERLGTPAGVSSTAERGSGDEHVPSRLTTPEADELHAMLARMAERGVRAAALEVSAQALVRARVSGLRFDVAGFTNLTHDHLDDFGTMEAYLAAKARLFEPGVSGRGVVCVDTEPGRRLADAAAIPVRTLASDPGPRADWTVADVEVTAVGTSFSLEGPDGLRMPAALDALGAHQAVDAGLAIAMLVEAGVAPARIEAVLRRGPLRAAVPGRMERVPGSVDPAVFIDVGHTPDAIEKSLRALRPLTTGALVAVFGADGDRDPSKRAPMGAVAAALADVVVVHDHHSRFEDPDLIRAMVVGGARGAGAVVHDVPDPAEAVRVAIHAAGVGGTVLWAGTGRTEYRDIGGVKRPWSFWDEAARAVREQAGEADRLCPTSA
ncbi:Mur ligase family protein [Amnibacterium endophyticum]|uniref:Mur ligase family protein n=1 Tax=Amnibacterium endophyticum TaxID=2109337 RepID=A0ABW4LKA3_9MICO